MTDSRSLKLVATISVASVATVATTYFLHRLWRLQRYWNAPFVEAGTVGKLFIFPVKSCKGIETKYLDCTVRGSKYNSFSDREFLIVDEQRDHVFLTARQFPKMVLIEVDQTETTLTVKFPTGIVVNVDLKEVENRNDIRRGALHGNKQTDGFDCGDEVGEALTNYLELKGRMKLRLLRFDPALFNERDVKSEPNFWLNPVPVVQDRAMYSDKTSFVAASSGSVVDLNEKLKKEGEDPVTILNFRINFYIETKKPFAEDHWLSLRIGEAEFVCFRPCTRCIMTTVDPATGEKNKKMQPFKKLREYRLAPEGPLRELYQHSPIFGVHLALVKSGRIHVGDKVYAQYKPSAF